MSEKDFDHIARVEKAIAEKYGEEAVSNPKANWNEEREKLFELGCLTIITLNMQISVI